MSPTGTDDARLKVKIIQWFRCFYLYIWSFCSLSELGSLACLTVFPTFQGREIRDAEQKHKQKETKSALEQEGF